MAGEEIDAVHKRQQLVALVIAGDIDATISSVTELFPTLLEQVSAVCWGLPVLTTRFCLRNRGPTTAVLCFRSLLVAATASCFQCHHLLCHSVLCAVLESANYTIFEQV